MKKSIFATVCGIIFGIVLMIGVFSILNMKPENEDVMAQGEEATVLSETFATEVLTECEETELEEEVVSTTKSNMNNGNPYYIRVNRLANCITIYTKDANGQYTVPVKAMACSVGSTGETPLGTSKISARYEWRLLFGNTYGHYTVRFNGHILFHSVPYMAPSNDTLKEGQYNLLGEPASQGCVRLSVADAKWIYDNCGNGTVVEVYESLDPGPLGKPSTIKISDVSPYRGWDPTDPNPNNPWLYGAVTLSGVKDLVVEVGESLDLLEGVGATDVDGLPITVTASGNVDVNTPGSYVVTYTATGVLGTTATATATITVKGTEDTETEVVPPVTEIPETEEPATETPSAGETETPPVEDTNPEEPINEVEPVSEVVENP